MAGSKINRQKAVRYGLTSVLGGLVMAWLVGLVLYPADNPPTRFDGVILSAQSDEVLRRACFDCHSNETKYPWYYHLPVTQLLMGHNINEGRSEVNFSEWAKLPEKKKFKMLRESVKETQEGEMPPLDYRLIHADSRLTVAEVEAMRQDVARLAGVNDPSGTWQGDHDKDGEDDDGDDDDDDDDGKRRRKSFTS